jgi:hypothetical protein
VLPNFKKTTSKIGTLKRKVSDSIEDTIEFLKTDNGKKVLTVGGGLLVAGTTLLLANLVEHDANNEEVSDSQSDENFSVSEVTDNDGSNSEVTDNDDSNSVVTHDYPDVRKSPIVHTVHRGETTFIRGGTDEEKQRFREENNLDF